jgi:ABC-type glutathione transport system ATPase component
MAELTAAPVLGFRITASYGKREVLHEVQATLRAGEIAALVGLSGSGKSTLAIALLRLLRYRGGVVEGSIRLNGRELIALSESEMRAIRGREIGYVPQSPASALNPRMRVKTLLAETWRAHAAATPAGSAPAFRELLESVHLPATEDFLGQKAGQLSTGQGQRLLIALAIMHNPPLILADEPTSALDAITQSHILKLFEELNRARNAAILFISHDLFSVAAISHRVDILNEGRIVESGTPEQIFRSPRHAFTQELVASMPRPL